MTAAPDFVLSSANVGEYLASRHIGAGAAAATELAGGVSGVVIAVDGPEPLVVKQALSSLRVSAIWTAPTDRAVTEARALEVLHGITPDHTPRVIDADPVNDILVMTRAPADWTNWRTTLLTAASLDESAHAHLIGSVLGQWHATTWADPALAASFDDTAAFEALRLAPFHREVARRHPRIRNAIEPLIDELLALRQTLVHGDYSPKNILASGTGMWVLDFEVARFGAAVFDLAFMLCHLTLKGAHRPGESDRLHEVATTFLDGYRAANRRWTDERALGPHVAAILLARVDGKSPAGYLDEAERDAIRTSTLDLLTLPGPTFEDVWAAVVGRRHS